MKVCLCLLDIENMDDISREGFRQAVEMHPELLKSSCFASYFSPSVLLRTPCFNLPNAIRFYQESRCWSFHPSSVHQFSSFPNPCRGSGTRTAQCQRPAWQSTPAWSIVCRARGWKERESVHRERGPQTGKSQVYGPRILKLPILQGIEQWKCNVMSPVGFRSWRSQIVTLAVARGACQAHTGLREIDEADLKPLGGGKMLVVKVACNGEPWWANDTYCCQYAAFAMRRVWLALILVNNQINIM